MTTWGNITKRSDEVGCPRRSTLASDPVVPQRTDSETGLDFFGARYYGAALGRWTSPDLVNLTDDRLLNPSNTINKYIYGGDNPLKYVDSNGRDITVFYEQKGSNRPNIMLAAYNQQNNDFAFLSVGPQTHLDPAILSHPFEGVPGTSEFNLPQTVDDLRKNFASLTIQTSPEVAQQAIDAIRNGAGTRNWALFGNNCTSACAKVLKDIGLYLGSKSGLPWTPTKLWANLNLLYGKGRPPAFVRSILGPTIGGSDLITPTFEPGRDFGNPRYGMDTFDWLMLQLKAPLKACVTVTDSASGTTSTECQ
jgi:RHS repeat-associated protein